MNTAIIEKIKPEDFGMTETQAQEVESVFTPVINERENLIPLFTELVSKPISQALTLQAHDLRMKLVKVRTNTDKIHKAAKAFYLAGGRFVDAWKNKNITVIEQMESQLSEIENYYVNLENERIAKLKEERLAKLSTVCDNPYLFQVEQMTDEAFNNLYEGQKLIKEQAEIAEKKAEEERLAKEKAEAEEREKIRLENERLRKEAEEKEKQLAAERAKAESERKAIEEKAKKEREEAERKLKAEQESARIAAEKAAAERAKLEAEIKARKEAEAAAEQARIEAEKKAAKAPDKDKLKALVAGISFPTMPEFKSNEAKATADVIASKFEAFKNWANAQIENI